MREGLQLGSAVRLDGVGVIVVMGVVRVIVDVVWVPGAIREYPDRASLNIFGSPTAFNVDIIGYVSISLGINLRHDTRDRGREVVAYDLDGVGDVAWGAGHVVRGEASA